MQVKVKGLCDSKFMYMYMYAVICVQSRVVNA